MRFCILILELEFMLPRKARGVQGGPSGVALHFVDFDLRVPPCCRGALPILPDLQQPKQNCAHSGRS